MTDGDPRRRALAATPGLRRLLDRGLPLLVALAAVLLACFRIADSDVFWHVEHGERMLSEHSFVSLDDWSFTAAGSRTVYYSWLAEIAMALVFRLGGYAGLVAAKALLAGAVLLLLSGALGARSITGLPRAVLLLAALALLRFRFYARPEMFTLLLIPGVDWLCLRWLRLGSRRSLVALPPLVILWANLHPYVIVGLGVLGAHAIGGLLEARFRLGQERTRRASLLLAATALAAAGSLVNPWGWRIYAPLLKLWDSGPIGLLPTREWEPPSWEGFSLYFVLAAVAVLLILATMRRARPAELILFAAGLALSLASLRNVGLFALMAAPATGRAVTVLAGLRPVRSPRVLGALALAQVALLLVLVATLLSPHASPLHLDESRNYRPGLGLGRDSAPIGATRFARRAGLEGPVWNSWALGGWIIRCCWPEMRVSLDGRQLPYERHLARILEVGVERRIAELDVRFAIVLLDDRLSIDGLRASGTFALVYFDDLAAVFVRGDELTAHPGLLGFEWLRPDERGLGWMQSLEPGGLAEAAAEAERAVRLAPDSSRAAMLRGLLLRRQGFEAAGRAELERAVTLDPTQATHFVNLGVALLDTGHPEEAAGRLREAVRLDPRSAPARYDLALAMVDLERPSAARRQLRRSLELDPAQPRAQLLLGGLELERGALAEARRHAEEALRLAGGDEVVREAAQRLLLRAGGSGG